MYGLYKNWYPYPYLPVAVPRQVGAVDTPPQPPAEGRPRERIFEESFLETLLLLNKGNVGTFYFTYPNNSQWNAKSVRGTVMTSGRDHIVIREMQSDKRIMLLMANLDWVEFEGEIRYPSPPAYSSQTYQASAQPPEEGPIVVPPPIVTG